MVNGRLRCSLNGKFFEYYDYEKTLSHVSCYVEDSLIRGTLYKNGQEFHYYQETVQSSIELPSTKITIKGPGQLKDLRIHDKRSDPLITRH